MSSKKKDGEILGQNQGEISRNSQLQERSWPGFPAESAGTQKARKRRAYNAQSQGRSRMTAAPMPPPIYMVTMP